LRYQDHEISKEFRRGYEGERIIDWAEKSWGVSPIMTCVTLNGKDWTPSNFIPQDSVIDFVPRFPAEVPGKPESQVEESKNEVPVFVDLLDHTRVWKLTRGFEWASFKPLVAEIADGVKWNAIFGGAIWCGETRAPEKNMTISVNLELPGAGPPRRIPTTHLWVQIEGRPKFPLGPLRGQEWNQIEGRQEWTTKTTWI
jgi:hypothetical protein